MEYCVQEYKARIKDWRFMRLISWPDCVATRNIFKFLVHEKHAGSLDPKINILLLELYA